MKKVLIILAVLVCISITMSLSGCREYTCECTLYNLHNPEPGSSSAYPVKKRHQEKMCTSKSTQPDSAGSYLRCVVK